jgi:hypothetical protein
VTEVVYLPQEFYVGDRVEVRVRLRVDDASLELETPLDTPELSWADLHDMRVVGSGRDRELRLLMTPFEPGTKTLAQLDLGGIVLRDLEVRVPSLLEDGTVELAPSRGQLLLTGTRLLVALGLALLVSVPALWILLFRWAGHRLKRAVHRHRRARPYRRLLKRLRNLALDLERVRGREFYIRLLTELRAYLSSRFDVGSMSFTTAELSRFLEELVDDPKLREELVSVFHFGDLVKFAERGAPTSLRAQHLRTVGTVASRLEDRDETAAIRRIGRRGKRRTGRVSV